jgi:hypothetical protein
LPARTPSYCLHKSTAQAVVTIDGRDFYLGKQPSGPSHQHLQEMSPAWIDSFGVASLQAIDPRLVQAPFLRASYPTRLQGPSLPKVSASPSPRRIRARSVSAVTVRLRNRAEPSAKAT